MSKKGSAKGKKKGIEFSYKIEGEDVGNVKTIVLPENHLKQGKLYKDFCILNQEFLKYVISCKLTKTEYNILMFLLAYMDIDNKVIIDAEMIEYHLKIGASNVNKYITKLQEKKIIYKRNLGYRKGAEVLLNFDIISPHMAFKNKNNRENVTKHKVMMQNEPPYIKQKNAFTGLIDYVNPDTGEVFLEE